MRREQYCFMRRPDEAIFQEATQKGVLLAAQIESTHPDQVQAELNKYARWPAVGMVLLPRELVLEMPLRPPVSSLIRAVEYRHGESVPPWAQVLIVKEQCLGRSIFARREATTDRMLPDRFSDVDCRRTSRL